MYYRENKLNYKILRISNPYGLSVKLNPQQGLIGNIIDRLSRGADVEVWGDGLIVRDYIYIDDVVSALYLAAMLQTNSNIINVGTGVGSSVNEVINVISKVMDEVPNLIYLDKRSFDVPFNILDSNLAYAELSWKPKWALEAGVSNMIRLMRA